MWDEDNLAVNELIKADLAPSKIDDPKTPYHAPLSPDTGVIDGELAEPTTELRVRA